jgi:hypothetical protein
MVMLVIMVNELPVVNIAAIGPHSINECSAIGALSLSLKNIRMPSLKAVFGLTDRARTPIR